MRLLSVVGLLLWLAWQPSPAAADAEDWAVARGWYFGQSGGYVVSDAEGQPFWSTYRGLGGVSWLGYPLSGRFTWRDKAVQVFQRAVLAYNPTTRTVEPLDLLGLFTELGLEGRLLAEFQVPPAAKPGDEGEQRSLSWPGGCVPCRRLPYVGGGASLPRAAYAAERRAWLTTVPRLAQLYDAAPGSARLLGLPTSRPRDFGAHTSVRFERGVLQLWRGSYPWAATGHVTVANLGEIARTLAVFGTVGQWASEKRAAPPLQRGEEAALAARAPATAPSRQAGASGPIVGGRPESGIVALTFDLGIKGPGALPDVLDTLRARRVWATFFITGVWAEDQPALLRRIVAEGHEISNHTYDHPNLTSLDSGTALRQIERTEQIAQALVGQTTRPYFRPPFGAYNQRVLDLVEAAGYRLVMWTLDSADWRPESDAATVARRVGARTDAGDIAVMHGYVPKTAQALPAILDQLAARGLRAGTLSDVLRRE